MPEINDSFQTLMGAKAAPNLTRVLVPLKAPKGMPVSVKGMPMGPVVGLSRASGAGEATTTALETKASALPTRSVAEKETVWVPGPRTKGAL